MHYRTQGSRTFFFCVLMNVSKRKKKVNDKFHSIDPNMNMSINIFVGNTFRVNDTWICVVIVILTRSYVNSVIFLLDLFFSCLKRCRLKMTFYFYVFLVLNIFKIESWTIIFPIFMKNQGFRIHIYFIFSMFNHKMCGIFRKPLQNVRKKNIWFLSF